MLISRIKNTFTIFFDDFDKCSLVDGWIILGQQKVDLLKVVFFREIELEEVSEIILCHFVFLKIIQSLEEQRTIILEI
jgi:hypothetical protein